MMKFLKAGAVAAISMWAGVAFAEGDAAKGEAVFKKNCKVCHAIGADAKPGGVGPVQNGVYGAKAGARAGYSYSKAMTDYGASGIVWNDETLDKYLENPKGVVVGTKMAFVGLKKPEDRGDVIAYLKTFTTQ